MSVCDQPRKSAAKLEIGRGRTHTHPHTCTYGPRSPENLPRTHRQPPTSAAGRQHTPSRSAAQNPRNCQKSAANRQRHAKKAESAAKWQKSAADKDTQTHTYIRACPFIFLQIFHKQISFVQENVMILPMATKMCAQMLLRLTYVIQKLVYF